MKAFGRTELTTVELESELQFVVVRHDGWADLIAMMVLILFMYIMWKWQNYWTLGFIAGISILSIVARWLHGRTTILRVTEFELGATGNLGRMFSAEVRVPASDVTSIRYESSGLGDFGGVYLRRRWRRNCVLPGLSATQASEVVCAIYRRFPAIGSKYHDPEALPHGTGSDPITPGLSDFHPEDGSFRG
jgi:hypothetical protein